MPNSVRTLFVAYGGGINPVGMTRFNQMAVAGSCPGGDSDHPDCEPTIVANTPADLKTTLTSKIRQILAEKLSFTAPSITATVQEGGALYQAQFTYDQWGEWNGTILRKSVDIWEIPCQMVEKIKYLELHTRTKQICLSSNTTLYFITKMLTFTSKI